MVAKHPKPLELSWPDLAKLPLKLAIVREAHDQACKLHDDVLETKESYERRALALLGLYITLATAAFGAFYVVRSKGQIPLAIGLGLAGSVFALGCYFCLRAIEGSNYGTRGSSPEIWVTKRTLTGDENEHALMLAHVTTLIYDRIRTSSEANGKKAAYLWDAITAGIAAPILFGVFVILGSVL